MLHHFPEQVLEEGDLDPLVENDEVNIENERRNRYGGQ